MTHTFNTIYLSAGPYLPLGINLEPHILGLKTHQILYKNIKMDTYEICSINGYFTFVAIYRSLKSEMDERLY